MDYLLPPKSGSGRQIEMWTQQVSSFLNQFLLRRDIRTGSANPTSSVVPNYIGEIYIDTTAHKVYIAEALTNTSWLVMN
jgi:hypothetical protein